MSIYGGLEYTEDSNLTNLVSCEGNVNPGHAVAPERTLSIGGQNIGVYSIDPTNDAWLGNPRSSDHQVCKSGRVKLTNDTLSAEWVIEAHEVDGLTVDTMMKNMKDDIGTLIALRQQIKQTVDEAKAATSATNLIVLAPGAATDLYPPGAQGLFYYRKAAPAATGTAQITVQYRTLATITRICLINAARWLPGKKIEPGDDVEVVAGTTGVMHKAKYETVGSSSHAAAQTLLEELTKQATAIASVGGILLSKSQVGLVMLMILNDAMASAMSRHADTIGQAADKNMQRLFPKSRRNDYVLAVAQRPIADTYMTTLRANVTAAADAMGELIWNSCDALALETSMTKNELSQGSDGVQGKAKAIAETERRAIQGQKILPMELDGIKNAVLGDKGALVARWIKRAVLAYTDCTTNATEHYDTTSGHSHVITSLALTPIAGDTYAAVYELRRNEIPMTKERQDEVLGIMRKLFSAV
ncbi:hypothetical protein AB0F17_10885 [Nonomuraea sp. NPDC026600]|uniref:hypothetical protein n=1 Tax=Nonomuraea sp. NPDC026600 TaxID=3155363 RepID=UPI0033E02392